MQPGSPIELIDHLSAKNTHLIELKESIDGFLIAFFRRIQESAALIHFFFFCVRGSTSLHAHPFRRFSAQRGAQYSGNNTIVLGQINYLQRPTSLWSLFLRGYNSATIV